MLHYTDWGAGPRSWIYGYFEYKSSKMIPIKLSAQKRSSFPLPPPSPLLFFFFGLDVILPENRSSSEIYVFYLLNRINWQYWMCKAFFGSANQDPLILPSHRLSIPQTLTLPMEKVHVQGWEKWCKHEEVKRTILQFKAKSCISAWLSPSCTSLVFSYDFQMEKKEKKWERKVFKKIKLPLKKNILRILLKILICSTVTFNINFLDKLQEVITTETFWKPSFKN